ncbi:MAG TPA: hypothetical protein VMP01_09195 [Pirellulaceae bacterium]|nr:hypothetical protein [Pirellulaceae bacterium]
MWTLSENLALLSLGPLNVQIDLTHVERGLDEIRIAGHGWENARLLSVRLPSRTSEEPLAPLESYVRGTDLVAIYPSLPPYTIQSQIYWRARQQPSLSAIGVELIVSVQTSQLYSEPQTPIWSTIPDALGALIWMPGDQPRTFVPTPLPRTLSAARGDHGIVACGIPGTNQVYVEMIHPSDLDAMNVEAADGGVRVSAEVFQEHLEKGVIRRARVCGWLVPAADWQRRAWSLYESYRLEHPPLTA